MNGLDVQKVYYNLDGAADWLKSIVRTVHIYEETTHRAKYNPCTLRWVKCVEVVTCVESVAALRAVRLYNQKTKMGA
jgi:hypothetical protein